MVSACGLCKPGAFLADDTYVFFSQHLCSTRDLILWSCWAGQSAVLIPARLDKGRHVRMMREIMDVPLPRAASSLLMSFLTFHISI